MPSKLSEISTRIFSGGTPSTQCDEYWGGDIPWLSSGETSNRYIVKTQNHITLEGVENSSTKLAKKNTIVIASAGQGLTRGQTSLLCLDTYINQSIIAIEINPSLANPLFVFFNISTRYEELRSISDGTSSRGSLTTKLIGELEIDLPERDVQDKIAYLISTIDGKIRTDQSINDNLLSQLQLLYNNLLDDVSSNIRIGSIAKIYSGGTPNTSTEEYWGGDYNWLSSGETRNRFISSTEKTITKSGVDNSSTRLAHEYDTVIASAGQGLTRGQVSMLFTETYVNQSIIVVNSGEEYAYLIYCNLSNRYEELRNISDSTSIRGSITTKMIADLEIPVVDTELLSEFNNNVKKILFKIRSNLKEIRCLSFFRDYLTPKLMSGEIDVSSLGDTQLKNH